MSRGDLNQTNEGIKYLSSTVSLDDCSFYIRDQTGGRGRSTFVKTSVGFDSFDTVLEALQEKNNNLSSLLTKVQD